MLTCSLLLQQGIEVCTAHGLSSDHLARLWGSWCSVVFKPLVILTKKKESFLVNNVSVKDVSLKVWEKFKVEVVAKLPSKTPAKLERGMREDGGTPSTAGSGGNVLPASFFGRYGMAPPQSAPATPMESKKRPIASVVGVNANGSIKAESMFASSSPSANQSTPVSAGGVDNYVKRRGAGEVRLHFNSQLADVVVMGAAASVKKVVTVQVIQGSGAEKPFKYMWNPLEGRSAVFKDTLNRLGNFVLSKHEEQINGLELSSFHLPQTDEVLCFGKICTDSSDGKLEARGVLIEGQAPENDNIYRVKLDLKACPSFSLFPGQIVLLRGVNPTGQSLVVKKLLSDASLPVATTEESHVYEQGTVKVTIAVGPFCSSENLDYRPLSDLMDVVLSNSTDVLVLMGPFVDAKHPDIERGDIGRTYDDLFEDALQHHVLRRVDAHNSTAARGKLIQRVVLIPSLQDMHHHSVFPQFPFSSEAFSSFREFLLMASNPCQLRINGVVFGFTTTDPLKHMGGAALLQRPPADGSANLSRILEMASLLVDQQSFMPLNPAPVDINLDTSTNLTGVDFGDSTPQILVLPSALKEFVDPLRGTLVVNPSFLVRGGSGGGTFAEVVLYPKGSDNHGGNQPMDIGAEEESANTGGYHVLSKVGVKIIKI
jgi:hypothetical protein